MSIDPDRTVFVVGAGASKEVGLPIGTDLTRDIAAALDFRVEHTQLQRGGDEPILGVLRVTADREQVMDRRDHPLNAYLRAAWRIRDAMPQALSIDNFIDSHKDEPHVPLCGKLAIVQTILQAESSSKLFVDPSNIYNKIEFEAIRETWFARFFQRVAEGCSKADIRARLAGITFIVFNYDRCVEHFVHGSLQNYYRMTSEEAAEAMTSLEVLHPYGAVGELPWQTHSQAAIAFGAKAHPTRLADLAGAIRTFTEGMRDRSGELDLIRSRVSSAGRLIFLGFAFHRQNMQLILTKAAQGTRVFGSTYRMSKSDVKSIEDDLQSRGFDAKGISLEPVTCSSLYEEYSRSLSFVS